MSNYLVACFCFRQFLELHVFKKKMLVKSYPPISCKHLVTLILNRSYFQKYLGLNDTCQDLQTLMCFFSSFYLAYELSYCCDVFLNFKCLQKLVYRRFWLTWSLFLWHAQISHLVKFELKDALHILIFCRQHAFYISNPFHW